MNFSFVLVAFRISGPESVERVLSCFVEGGDPKGTYPWGFHPPFDDARD